MTLMSLQGEHLGRKRENWLPGGLKGNNNARHVRTDSVWVQVGRSPGWQLPSLDFVLFGEFGTKFKTHLTIKGLPARTWRSPMSETRNQHLQDVAILTQAVENVFRKLIRFLVGRISLVKLQEMIRIIFVQEAEKIIQSEHPRKHVSLTQLGLMAGLDTRTLTKIRNDENYRKPLYATNTFLKEITPGVAILDMWNAKPPYFDLEKRQPKSLKIAGDQGSFEALFSETVRSRGITANSMLKRLAESGSVRINEKDGTVSLIRALYLPSAVNEKLDAIAVGFSAMGNLVDTVVHNLKDDGGRFFQRGAWTYRLPGRHQQEARDELRKLLQRTEETAKRLMAGYEEPNAGPDQITAGIGLFYFEETE